MSMISFYIGTCTIYIDPMGNASILWGNGLKIICPLCYISNKKGVKWVKWGAHANLQKMETTWNGAASNQKERFFSDFFCLCSFLFFALGEVGLDFGFSTSMGVRVNETTFLDGFTQNGSCVGWCFKDCLFFDWKQNVPEHLESSNFVSLSAAHSNYLVSWKIYNPI